MAERAAGNGGARRQTARRKKTARRRRLWVRLARIAIVIVVVLIAIPVVLTPVYRLVPPVSTLMLTHWLTGQPVDRRWVPLEAIAPVLVDSVLMSEDGQFCSHRGVDWGALREVINAGEPSRGASTIAMQTARNLFLWQSRNYIRKGLELPIAFYADLVLGKRRLMEIYLNIAEWGPGIFGVEAAAQYHFGVAAAKLTARQAALLAVTLPNPFVRDPAHPSRRLSGLARRIEARARTAGDYAACLKR